MGWELPKGITNNGDAEDWCVVRCAELRDQGEDARVGVRLMADRTLRPYVRREDGLIEFADGTTVRETEPEKEVKRFSPAVRGLVAPLTDPDPEGKP